MKLVQYHLYIITRHSSLYKMLFVFIYHKKIFEIETLKKKEDIRAGLQCIDSVQIMDIYFIY
jgi:hypothetical protein